MAPDLIARYARLEKALKKLENLRKTISRETFLADSDVQDIAEHNFQVSIEAVIDLANHLVSERGFKKPETNVEIFEILAAEKILEKSFADKLSDWVRFRNILVHNYAEIKPQRVHEILTSELDDLRQAASVLAGHLKLI